MKIALNITPAVRQTTGIGTYAKELVSALLGYDKENKYTLFFSKNPFSRRRMERDFVNDRNVISASINLPYWFLNLIWNELGKMPVEHLCGPCDIFHSLDILSPFTNQAKIVTTVHDINWIVFSDLGGFSKKILYREASKSLARSKGIIAVSNFTKRELLKHFPFLKEDRIEVIYSGVSDAFRPLDNSTVEDGRQKYKWGEFILYLGVLNQSRKNLTRLVRAYSQLKTGNRISEKLVLCGRPSRSSQELMRLISELGLSNDIVVYDRWIPEDDIPLVYNMAKFLVYPSLYEGYGFPILEAMACGTPVLTSKASSMPEVGGDACLYADPYDIDALTCGMQRLLRDGALREELSNIGLVRAKRFTWQNTAHMTMRLYKKVFEEG